MAPGRRCVMVGVSFSKEAVQSFDEVNVRDVGCYKIASGGHVVIRMLLLRVGDGEPLLDFLADGRRYTVGQLIDLSYFERGICGGKSRSH